MRLFTNLVYPDVNWKSHELLCAFEGCIYYPRPRYFYWNLANVSNAKVIRTVCVKEKVSLSVMCFLNPTPVIGNYTRVILAQSALALDTHSNDFIHRVYRTWDVT